jgi:hypothetical protein
MLNGNALSQLTPTLSGIHLFWTGPFSWVYSPGGWNIQRRPFSRRKPLQCEVLQTPLIDRLRSEKEIRLPFGWLTHRNGQFDENTPAEIFRLDLDEATNFVQVSMKVKLGFTYALYREKVVAVIPPKNSGTFTIHFAAPAIDAIVSYILDPQSIQYCIGKNQEAEDESWNDVPFLIKNLQLPITDLNPSLHNPDDEFQEAKSRLLPGEDLEPAEFKHLMGIIRPSVKTNSHPRHIDKVLLLREDEASGFEELNATAPLLSLIGHPKWRRVLGFGWFDKDPALQQGQMYEYRITGFFPLEDLHDRVYGFHTISSNTLLPSCFFLGDLMLRFSQPPRIELTPGTSLTGKQQLSRRGISLQIPDQSFWSFSAIHTWSVVIDFPNPLQHVQFELLSGHSLEYEAWNSNNNLIVTQGLPSGEIVRLDFASPVSQIRLKGKGFLFTIRTTQSLQGLHAVSVVLPPVLYQDTPVPGLPSIFQATNLQKIGSDNVVEGIIPTVASRSALGFQLNWEPSLQNGLTYWPPDEPNAHPVESTLYQIEHRQIPDNNWRPLLPQENWVLGHRKNGQGSAEINQGVDLMTLFPESPTSEVSSHQLMIWEDVFDFPVNGQPVIRPVPDLGTTHQYRIRAIDIIGRSSIGWKESNLVDLQKLIPPPVPIGPKKVINDEPDFASPNGVHARLLVRDAPDLTAAESALLGDDDNMIILRWGWHQEQRDLDPYTREFRIYTRNNALESIESTLTSVVDLGLGRFECTFQLERSIKVDAIKNSFLQIGGHPFFVRMNQAGLFVKMILERRMPDGNGALSGPPLGPVTIPLLLDSSSLQANVWTARVGVVPVTDAVSYSFEFRNLLPLSLSHTRAEAWIGVSASDDQPYVQDKLSPVENRNGNESPIVPAKVQGRYWGRPQFSIPPSLEPVPQLLTREPEKSPIQFQWNVIDFLPPGSLAGVTHIRLERASAGIILNHYRVTPTNQLMAIGSASGQPDVEIMVPNPDDKTRMMRALRQTTSNAMEDHYLVFLAGSHPYRSDFFEPVTPNPILLGPVTDTFLPQTNRYVYRIKTGNAAELISEGDAMLKMIVRVPSTKPGAVPTLIPFNKNNPPGIIKVKVEADVDSTHVVLFYAPPGTSTRGPVTPGSLLRIANRPDLYPERILRFRTSEGDYAHQIIKNLNDADIETDDNDVKTVTFTLEEDPGTVWRVWACTLTKDGIPSDAAGPLSIPLPVLQP